MTENNTDYILDTALKAALSGAAFGAPLGVAGRLWSGGKKISDLIRAGLVGGSLGAGAAGGSVLTGSALLGEPAQGETSPYTVRGGLGGAMAGGGLGAIIGALAASGKLPRSLPASLAKYMPKDNIVSQKLRSFGGQPGGMRKGAALGGATVGIPSAVYGADEGMGLDVVAQELQKERLKEALGIGY